MTTLGDICAVACADLFRGDGAIMASPMAPIPRLGVLLARKTFAPDLVLSDGVATLVDDDGKPEGWMPFSRVFDTLWNGRRHVVMGASQIDRHANQNLSCLGDHARPKVQLLGSRGAPGNTICHTTSYWVPDHSTRVFVPDVDFVSGVGMARGAAEIRRIVTNLCVMGVSATDGCIRLVSLHPGVTLEKVVESTGFAMHIPDHLPVTRAPHADEAALLELLDPGAKIRGTVTA
jgi:acyl CoA:acetate/3-ketoacid CoA transferase beta subunit